MKFSYSTDLEATLPAAWLRVIDAVAKASLGRDDRTDGRLVDDLVRLSRAYTVDRDEDGWTSVPRGRSALAARLRFFFVRDVRKSEHTTRELLRTGALSGKRTVSLLDLGAGLGATTVGAALALKKAGVDAVSVTALDSDKEALALMASLTEALAHDGETSRDLPAITLTTRATTFDDALASEKGPFDLALAGFVWNELPPDERRAERFAGAARRSLGESGALVLLEPALREPTRRLQALRDAFVASGEWSAVVPCTHDAPCPMLASERDWCHASLPLALPAETAEIARGAGLRYERLSFAHAAFVKNRAAREDASLVRVVSDALVSKGKHEAIVCGAGGLVRLRLLDRERSPSNRALLDASRGDLVRLSSSEPRVREDTIVERLPPSG